MNVHLMLSMNIKILECNPNFRNLPFEQYVIVNCLGVTINNMERHICNQGLWTRVSCVFVFSIFSIKLVLTLVE